MLRDKVYGSIGKAISWLLIFTTQTLTIHMAFAESDMTNAVIEANEYAKDLLNKRSAPAFNAQGDLMVGGKTFMSQKALTGQKEDDYVPADVDTFGSDTQTLIQGQAAQAKYDEKTLETASSSGERAYHIVKKSFATQKPDLTNDPMWENTDNVLANLEDIAKDFANCEFSTELVSTGQSYHVPKYETCERLPAVEENFFVGHEYEVGVIKHKSGPVNLQSCGDGCIRMWIGTVGDNYWGGWCTIYEESMSIEVIQPDAISYATLERSKFDDYHQVYLNDVKVYNGPNGNFPPEQGTQCELSVSWDVRPNINVTSFFNAVEPKGEMKLKTRTSVAGNGEGYSSLLIYYDPDSIGVQRRMGNARKHRQSASGQKANRRWVLHRLDHLC